MRLALILIASLLVGCATKPAVIYQNGTIDGLLDGNYDGEVHFAEVRKHGDFGLGTFNAVDGEMLALDGEFYRIRSDGSVHPVKDAERTPLAVVTFFRPDSRGTFHGDATSYRSLHHALDRHRTHDGRAYAIRIDGHFTKVRVRSVGLQQKPYPPLVEVVKSQSEWELTDVEGTLVGFWFPYELRHVNVPGYHFHFITRDRKQGGHVQDLTLTRATSAMQELDAVHLHLNREPATVRPTTNRTKDLEQVEK